MSVAGKVRPLIVNPAPVTLACEMFTLEPPVLVNVSDTVEVLPTCTLPKAILGGFGERAPAVAPVPEIGTLRVGFPPSEVMVTLPLAAPAAAGVNFTLNDVLCPAVRVSGKLGPLMLKPLPLADAAEIVTLDPPELVSVSGRVFEFPITTLPKLKLAGLGVS